MKSVALMKHN